VVSTQSTTRYEDYIFFFFFFLFDLPLLSKERAFSVFRVVVGNSRIQK
jgi:hypothetical protein